jgi:hypothetical protein
MVIYQKNQLTTFLKNPSSAEADNGTLLILAATPIRDLAVGLFG